MRVIFWIPMVLVLALASCAPQMEGEPSTDPVYEEPQSLIPKPQSASESVVLSTYSWDYAPWLQQFQTDLNETWIAPYAYRLGVISGEVSLQVDVLPSGEFFDVLVTELEGHESFRGASLRAIEVISGLTPLPGDFPEEKLRIHLTLYYPEWTSR